MNDYLVAFINMHTEVRNGNLPNMIQFKYICHVSLYKTSCGVQFAKIAHLANKRMCRDQLGNSHINMSDFQWILSTVPGVSSIATNNEFVGT